MKRSEVYSWRVAPELKSALEHEARRDGSSVGALLEKIARQWLNARRRPDDEEEQKQLHESASNWIGSIDGDPDWSVSVRETVKRRLQARRER